MKKKRREKKKENSCLVEHNQINVNPIIVEIYLFKRTKTSGT